MLMAPREASACGGFDASERIRTTSESAILVFDENKREERFIRRASFATNASHRGQQIGFIVPTPSRPTLEEVDNVVFEELDQSLQDSKPHGESSGGGGLGCGGASADDGAAGESRGVEVVEQTRVAGQDATVLLASDPRALTDWLEANGFALEPAMKSYFDGYVEKGWYLTAFRYRPSSEQDRLDIKAVSMRFQTERAFYPYREAPSVANSDQGRSLRIYTLASAPQRAELGEGGMVWGAGQRTWVAEMNPGLRARLAPLGELPASTMVTTYEDFSNPRNGTDELWFSGDATLTTETQSNVLSGVVGSPAGLLALTWLLRRRRATPRAR